MTKKLGRCLVSVEYRGFRELTFCAPRDIAWAIRSRLRQTGALARLRSLPCGNHRFAWIESNAPNEILLSIILDYFENLYRIEKHACALAVDADGRVLPAEGAIQDVIFRSCGEALP